MVSNPPGGGGGGTKVWTTLWQFYIYCHHRTTNLGTTSSNPGRPRRFSSSPERPDRPWVPVTILFNEYRGLFREWGWPSLPSNADIRNEWNYASTSLIHLQTEYTLKGIESTHITQSGHVSAWKYWRALVSVKSMITISNTIIVSIQRPDWLPGPPWLVPRDYCRQRMNQTTHPRLESKPQTQSAIPFSSKRLHDVVINHKHTITNMAPMRSFDTVFYIFKNLSATRIPYKDDIKQ